MEKINDFKEGRLNAEQTKTEIMHCICVGFASQYQKVRKQETTFVFLDQPSFLGALVLLANKHALVNKRRSMAIS